MRNIVSNSLFYRAPFSHALFQYTFSVFFSVDDVDDVDVGDDANHRVHVGKGMSECICVCTRTTQNSNEKQKGD